MGKQILIDHTGSLLISSPFTGRVKGSIDYLALDGTEICIHDAKESSRGFGSQLLKIKFEECKYGLAISSPHVDTK